MAPPNLPGSLRLVDKLVRANKQRLNLVLSDRISLTTEDTKLAGQESGRS